MASRNNPFNIRFAQKEMYTKEDMDALDRKLGRFAESLRNHHACRQISSQRGTDTVTVCVFPCDMPYGIERTYSFNPDCCRRRILSPGELRVMSWERALRDLIEHLRESLRLESVALKERALAYDGLAKCLAVTVREPEAKAS